MKYLITLSDEQEDFLDKYLAAANYDHKREEYPSLVINNFITSMMKRRKEDVAQSYKDTQLKMSLKLDNTLFKSKKDSFFFTDGKHYWAVKERECKIVKIDTGG